MSLDSQQTIRRSVCPLDCPDTCSLQVTVEDERITAVRGSRANPYTAGAICDKVAKYYPAFVHGERRLREPLRRVGEKGEGRFETISWDDALGLSAERTHLAGTGPLRTVAIDDVPVIVHPLVFLTLGLY